MYCLQLQDGVEALTESFDRLDSRVASVGQTAAKIGDHLEVKTIISLLTVATFSKSYTSI